MLRRSGGRDEPCPAAGAPAPAGAAGLTPTDVHRFPLYTLVALASSGFELALRVAGPVICIILLETIATVNSSVKVEDVIRTVVDKSIQVTGAERAIIMLLDDENVLRIALARDHDWCVVCDADEFRESPWPGMTLLDALREVDALGYSAVYVPAEGMPATAVA